MADPATPPATPPAACAPTTNVGAVTSQGTGSTAVSSPTVFNYPVQPPRDDGRMLAVASLVGGVIDALLGGESLGNATAAESTWKDILDNQMKAKGTSELAMVDTLRGNLPTFANDLSAQLTDWRAKADSYFIKLNDTDAQLVAQINNQQNLATTSYNSLVPFHNTVTAEIADQRTKSDDEWSRINPYDIIIKDEIAEYQNKSDSEYVRADAWCTDDAIRKLCEFVACGYTPDYAGIASRARADAELENQAKYQEACRLANRYNTRRHDSLAADIRLATTAAAIGSATKAREAERQFMWKTNQEMRFEHAKWLEGSRVASKKFAMDYDELRMKYAQERWTSHAKMSFEQDSLALKAAEKAWDVRADLAFKQDTLSVKTIEARWQQVANMYINQERFADAISTERWASYSNAAYKSFREGGEMLAGASQAYQFLAASIRATAKQGGGGGVGAAGALATLASVLTLFNGDCGKNPVMAALGADFWGRPKNCCGS